MRRKSKLSKTGFDRVLKQLHALAEASGSTPSPLVRGKLFERLMKQWLTEDPLYSHRFKAVWLWADWISQVEDFDGPDTGVDLVAEERDGAGFCAIQCKFHSHSTRITKKALDSFFSASDPGIFSTRMVIDTGAGWGPNATNVVERSSKPMTVVRFNDLAARPFSWPDLERGNPEDLALAAAAQQKLRSHQKKAIRDVREGFVNSDRGQLIMACGTGKTLTALKLAEQEAGKGKKVLYLVPSISLLRQSMRVFAEQKSEEIEHKYIGICSDKKAGFKSEDASLAELEMPVTTDLEKVTNALKKTQRNSMQVVFCTYQSLEIVEKAQKRLGNGTKHEFDLIICDEAHRTTGVERAGDEMSSFLLVHDQERIRGAKRLYMTATPRIYGEGARSKAAKGGAQVYEMSDEAKYGPKFHELSFADAIEQDLLSDYRVVILAVSTKHESKALEAYLEQAQGDINLSDSARIVGCWRALHNPENNNGSGAQGANGAEAVLQGPLQQAVGFTNTIKDARDLARHWEGVVSHAREDLPEDNPRAGFVCKTDYVEGKNNALDRSRKLEWLKSPEENQCNILFNCRCLAEGVDVPALDSILFMAEKKSAVEVIQAVGRVMRKAEGKQYGYIILPVAIPENQEADVALDQGEAFKGVWSVLRALRSHDSSLDIEINQIGLNKKLPSKIIVIKGNERTDNKGGGGEQPFLPLLDLPAESLQPRIVEKCGDRQYWKNWTKNVEQIFQIIVGRIHGLIENPDAGSLRKRFRVFHEELKASINKNVSQYNAVDVLAQHIITGPVFQALFEGYDFASRNPVAKALSKIQKEFEARGLDSELRGLTSFYESVKRQVKGVTEFGAREKLLKDLYENFFRLAARKDAERLGIVYSPNEVVDFIVQSADHLLREEFGRSLGKKGVNILDPFAGTGTFFTHLLQSPELIRDEDVARKYKDELYANEILLLAYYIGAVNIEQAAQARMGGEYESFAGMALADTFNQQTRESRGRKGLGDDAWFKENDERAARQLQKPIEVILGNPPWSAWQRRAADDNRNLVYPELRDRVTETYAERSLATLKNSLYDSYKMAFRWASDRLEECGIVAFVTNGSWITGLADSGVRACFAEEFSSIHVVDLRGNLRNDRITSQKEGGNIFNVRVPVAITLLVKKSKGGGEDCRIFYHKVADGMSREEKLAYLKQCRSVAHIKDWERIVPDEQFNWVNKGDKEFGSLYPVATNEARSGKDDKAVFRLFSGGLKTSRDAWLYNYSREECAARAGILSADYMGALRDLKKGLSIDEIKKKYRSSICWDPELENRMSRGKKISYSEGKISIHSHRPFIKKRCYVEYVLMSRPGRQPKVFPDAGNEAVEDAEKRENLVICVPGPGSNIPFSALITDRMPDLGFVGACQCFPRWAYDSRSQARGDMLEGQNAGRVDNITDSALAHFQKECGDKAISKDDLFYYVYGLLHSPAYRERFASNLSRSLPWIPCAPDFRAFEEAGRKLAELHINYETGQECNKIRIVSEKRDLQPEDYLLDGKMRFADAKKRDALVVNHHITLAGIPEEAHKYRVNGRTPLEWLISRLCFSKDEADGKFDDPNAWFENPADIVALIRRIVHLSVKSHGIINGLPSPFPGDEKA